MRLSLLCIAVLVAACSSVGDNKKSVKLVDVIFDAPADWQKTTTKSGPISTSLWVPETNGNKESVEVIRSEARKDFPTDLEQLGKLLEASEKSLPRGQAAHSSAFTTRSGRSGVRLDADFIPAGLHATYHRVHAVIVDAGVIVHVLYTAVTPEAELKTFDMVLQSIHREAA